MICGLESTGCCCQVVPAGTNSSSALAPLSKRIKIQIAVRQSRSGARCPTIVVGCSKAAALAFQVLVYQERMQQRACQELCDQMPNPAEKYSRKGRCAQHEYKADGAVGTRSIAFLQRRPLNR